MATKIPTITITDTSETANTSAPPTTFALGPFLFSLVGIGIAFGYLLLFLKTVETAIDDLTAFNVAACVGVGCILVAIVRTMVGWSLEERRRVKEVEGVEKWDAYLETGRVEVV